MIPIITTFVIAVIRAICALCALYAFAGAGVIRKLPLMKTGLVLISTIYLARALVLIPALIFKADLIDTFTVFSSLIILVYGLAYANGTWRAWPALRRRSA